LSSVLARAGGLTPRGSLRAAVFRRPGSAANTHAMRHELQERRRVELDRQAVAAAGDTAALRALAVQRALFQSMEADADLDRIVLSIDENKRWASTAADVVLEDGDLFTVPVLPSTVMVLGSVMNPGTLTARKGASVLEYVKLAGGFARDAERSLSYVLRANGEAIPLARASRVEAGDAVVISPKPVDSHSAGPSRPVFSPRNLQWMLQVATAAAVVFAAVK
jgi:protein involved in polysaccharide export with SLBB domain